MALPPWFVDAMVAYNTASIERRDGYAAQLHVDGRAILDVLRWCFESLPDEVLVGMDPHLTDTIAQRSSRCSVGG